MSLRQSIIGILITLLPTTAVMAGDGLASLAECLLTDGLAAERAGDGLSGDVRHELEELARVPARIMKGFATQMGQVVEIETVADGRFELEVQAGKGTVVHGWRVVRTASGTAKVAVQVGYDQLSPRERFRRLSGLDDGGPTVSLARGIFAYQGGREDIAAKYFAQSDGELSVALAGALKRRHDLALAAELEARAVAAWTRLLQKFEIVETAGGVNTERLTPGDAERLRVAVKAYKASFAQTRFAADRRGAIDRLAVAMGNAIPPGMVAPTLEVMDQVLLKLRRDNLAQEEWAVVWENKHGEARLDLSGNASLVDISALAGVAFRDISLADTGVKDLSPLRGMRLEKLHILGSAVEDVSILKDMPLAKLFLGRKVTGGLEVLEQLPLTYLHLGYCPAVVNASILQGKSLEYLHAIGTGVADLRVLRDMPLRELYLGRAVRNMEALRDMKELRLLYLHHCRGFDVRMVDNWKSLKYLYLIGDEITVRDLRPIVRLPLHTLVLDGVKGVADVAPLTEMTTLKRLVVPAEAKNIDALRELEGVQALDNKYDWKWPVSAEMFWRMRDFGVR